MSRKNIAQSAGIREVFEIPVSFLDVLFILIVFFAMQSIEKAGQAASKGITGVSVPVVPKTSGGANTQGENAPIAHMVIQCIRRRATGEPAFFLLHQRFTKNPPKSGKYSSLPYDVWPDVVTTDVPIAQSVEAWYPGGEAGALDESQVVSRLKRLKTLKHGLNMYVVIRASDDLSWSHLSHLYGELAKSEGTGGVGIATVNIRLAQGDLSNINDVVKVMAASEAE